MSLPSFRSFKPEKAYSLRREKIMHLMDKKRVITLVFFVLLIPAISFANAGTPLMWVGMFHLSLGNLLLGIGEGIVLAKLLKVSMKKAMLWMIGANYFSAFVGCLWLGNLIPALLKVQLETAWPVFWFVVFLAYLFTIVLELPFIYFAGKSEKKKWGRLVKVSVLIQTVSYIILFVPYYCSSYMTLYTENNIVPVESMNLSESVDVYYIAQSDGHVYRLGLDDLQNRLFTTLSSEGSGDRVFFKQSSSTLDSLDLIAYLDVKDSYDGTTKTLDSLVGRRALSHRGEVVDEDFLKGRFDYEGATWRNHDGSVLQLEEAKDSDWHFSVSVWAAGLRGWRKGHDDVDVSVAFETPFSVWYIRNALHLPGDIVLFQLGRDQICLFDPNKKEIALLAKGRGPTAVIRGEE
jgi:hypothetical protein